MDPLLARIQALQTRDLATSARLPSIDCQVCGGTTWEDIVIDGIARVQKCTACTAKRRGDPPGIPEATKGLTMASYDGKTRQRGPVNEEALRHAQLFLDGVHAGLYLWGPTGSGKTDLACAIVNTEWQRVGGALARFIRCTELMQRMARGGFGNDPDGEVDQLFESLATVDVLVLDDVGAQKGSDFSRRTLQDIFDRRTDKGRRTIWTSNYDLDTLAVQLSGGTEGDDRIPSRIAGNCKVVSMDDSYGDQPSTDFRMRQAAKRDRTRW